MTARSRGRADGSVATRGRRVSGGVAGPAMPGSAARRSSSFSAGSAFQFGQDRDGPHALQRRLREVAHLLGVQGAVLAARQERELADNDAGGGLQLHAPEGRRVLAGEAFAGFATALGAAGPQVDADQKAHPEHDRDPGDARTPGRPPRRLLRSGRGRRVRRDELAHGPARRDNPSVPRLEVRNSAGARSGVVVELGAAPASGPLSPYSGERVRVRGSSALEVER